MSEEIEQPARRARRKRITPVTGALAAVIVAAGGFIGGVHVQKSQAATTGAPAGGGIPTGGGMPSGGGPPGAQRQTSVDASSGTTGTVAYTKGDTLYVKDAEGNTIKVRVKSSAKVDRTASTDADDVQPGDSVVVQGEANAKGTVTATAITATEDAQ